MVSQKIKKQKSEKLFDKTVTKINQAPHARCQVHPKGTALHSNTFKGKKERKKPVQFITKKVYK